LMNQEALAPGCYCGDTVRKFQTKDYYLSETRYPRDLELPRHRHQHAYFCLIRRGGYAERYGSRNRECCPSDLVFHPPEEFHAERFHTDVVSFNVEVSKEKLNEWTDVSRVFQECSEFRAGKPNWLAHQLFLEFDRFDSYSRLAIEGLMLELMAHALRDLGCGRRKIPFWLGRVREALHDGYTEKVTLDMLADVAGVHPVHLATEFRRAYKCTVGEYVRRLRIEAACSSLRDGNTSIVDLCLDLGFSDQSHFSRTFKQQTGLSPGNYRSLYNRPARGSR
jgi:AraC family transcriptional regulator